LRTKDSFERFSAIANSNESCHGIKGPTVLSQAINFLDGILIDYMHLVCLGTFKSLLGLWFSSKNKTKNFYLGTKY
jgi:hypothetical protein